MALREIVKEGDELLRKKSKPVKTFDESLWNLLEDMTESMYKNHGMGLAAVQVGVLKRVVVMEVNGAFFEMINPEIISQKGMVEDEEACLSVPNKRGIVPRPEEVTVRFMDRFGYSMTITGEDNFARCVCHELDHLDGVLYVDKVINKEKPAKKGKK
jgi:peptide deformylase